MILEDSLIKHQLAELRHDFEGQPNSDWYDEYLRTTDAIDEWRFSSGDYFSPVPYEAERSGFPSPKIIKKSYETVDEARWRGKYCAGFLAGQHLVTVMPSEPNIQALDADFFSVSEEGIITIRSISCKSMHRPGKRSSRVIGMRRLNDLGEGGKLYLGVGEGGAWFVFIYKYLRERPVTALGYSNLATSGSGWEYHYDELGGLSEITSGSGVIWVKKR
ncbi:hypothetical protein M6G53_20400 [Serratia nevei]|uniref:hypothetical protein n=1 Tax=Serratia nevei TaxID=2703794 RepID=UPI00209F7D51|nr:hypothetical protein [Serratia nevei]MCP1107735.1 hypothetical protein [Serratia nevei]